MRTAMLAGLDALLGQLAPASVADQFEQVRARALAPGQDPRTGYWERYAELYRLLTQSPGEGLPHTFTEAFREAYARARESLRPPRRDREAAAG
jgi:predicted component of type VI protein secretion system